MTGRYEHLLVTGGCGFIGSNFVRRVLVRHHEARVTNVDLLTYSGNPANLADLAERHGEQGSGRYRFVHADIRDGERMRELLASRPGVPPVDAVVHFAAESHVDRSILGPLPFVATNVVGTTALLDACRDLRTALPAHFRFVHVSTDEVYGSLDPQADPFTETSPLAPNSPYAASKASSDLLVRAYVHTFGLPAVLTRCSNNYGPYQYPEKLIPLMITRAMRDEPLPVYGDGRNVRDWIHVEDHCAAVWSVLEQGEIGACYNIGAERELTNLEVVGRILEVLGKPDSLIRMVEDRPGHDRRYALSTRRIREQTGWRPEITFEAGIEATARWYLGNESWWRPLLGESERVARTLYRS
ncbi:MAG: dTDP-glucose 4,6-dehydratase [Gammaproteobacteria bacterium]|nr:dTDP-glucose 4,6-dehydratase [Gammaproteobacteria bacterium]